MNMRSRLFHLPPPHFKSRISAVESPFINPYAPVGIHGTFGDRFFWHLLSGVELLGDDSARLVLHVAARVAELPVGQSTYDIHSEGGGKSTG